MISAVFNRDTQSVEISSFLPQGISKKSQILQITEQSLLSFLTNVSYGRFDHEDWCTHRSSLATWNVDRRNINADKSDTSVDITSCLMCLSFHPVKPSWIVGGTFNGTYYWLLLGAHLHPATATSLLHRSQIYCFGVCDCD